MRTKKKQCPTCGCTIPRSASSCSRCGHKFKIELEAVNLADFNPYEGFGGL